MSSPRFFEIVLPSLTVPAGKTEYGFAVNAPFTGKVKRIAIKQTGGSNTSCSLDLYSTRVVETSLGPPTITYPKELFRIIPTQSVASGQALVLITDDSGFAYSNNMSGIAVPDRRIYLTLSGSGIANTVWVANIVVVTY